MSEDAEIREQLNRIERCLVGDAQMGQLGLVARVNNYGARINRLELWVFRVLAGAITAATIIAGIYKVVTEWHR